MALRRLGSWAVSNSETAPRFVNDDLQPEHPPENFGPEQDRWATLSCVH